MTISARHSLAAGGCGFLAAGLCGGGFELAWANPMSRWLVQANLALGILAVMASVALLIRSVQPGLATVPLADRSSSAVRTVLVILSVATITGWIGWQAGCLIGGAVCLAEAYRRPATSNRATEEEQHQ